MWGGEAASRCASWQHRQFSGAGGFLVCCLWRRPESVLATQTLRCFPEGRYGSFLRGRGAGAGAGPSSALPPVAGAGEPDAKAEPGTRTSVQGIYSGEVTFPGPPQTEGSKQQKSTFSQTGGQTSETKESAGFVSSRSCGGMCPSLLQAPGAAGGPRRLLSKEAAPQSLPDDTGVFSVCPLLICFF